MTLAYPSLFAAAPYGLEAQLFYNGLTLNANKNWPSGTVAAFYVTDLGGFDDADVRVANEPFPDRHGELAMPGLYGGRTLTITGYLLALNSYQLRIAMNSLRSAFNPLTEHALVVSTGDPVNGDVYIMCRKAASIAIKDTIPTDPFKWARREFMVSLRASDPRFLSFTQQTASSGATPTENTLVATTNSGTFSDYPLITITGPFASGLTITNNLSGVFFKTNQSVPDGEVWLADSNARTMKASNGANRFSAIDSTASWLTIEPGAGSLKLTNVAGTGGNSKVDVAWRHAWM